MDRTIDLLKEAQARVKTLLDDYELAMTKFREGYALLAKHMENAPATTNSSAVLSEREKEVFLLIGRGMTGAQIAEQLAISVKTFNAHRIKIRKKLGLKNVYELSQVAEKESVSRQNNGLK